MARKLNPLEAAKFTETSFEALEPVNEAQESEWFLKMRTQGDKDLSLSAELQAWLEGDFRSRSGF